jgi:dihydroorotate dehydrogenase electron transfer subunit
MVAGGTGAVPLLALLRTLATTRAECTFVLGANREGDLLFQDEIRTLTIKKRGILSVTTDDGSSGKRGLASDEAANLMRTQSHDRVYTCGPEMMMKKVIELAEEHHTSAEAGVERIFKCGSGICGSCCIGPYFACKDGPVFTGDVLRQLPEFGNSARDHSGRPVAVGARH